MGKNVKNTAQNRENGGSRPAVARLKTEEKSIRPVIRVLAVFLLFTTVCVIYSFILVGTIGEYGQSQSSDDEEYTVRTAKIQAVRGEIFDRNGKALVTNEYIYSLKLEYGLMSATVAEQNSDIAEIMAFIRKEGLIDSTGIYYCPLTGTYPDYTFGTVIESSSVAKSRLYRIESELGLSSSATANELAAAIAKKYKLFDSEGQALYDTTQMTDIIRVRYELDAIQFSYLQPLTLLESIDERQLSEIRVLGLGGTDIGISYTRVYEYPGYASHILGRIGKIPAESLDYYLNLGYQTNDTVGLDGCEKAFETYLRGIDGEKKITYDKSGHIVKEEIVTEAVPGKDVYLTIDIDIQIAAEDSLVATEEYVRLQALKTKGDLDGEDCNAGAVVVEKVGTGEILAIASNPTYDLTTFSQNYTSLANDESKPLFNRALNGTYAPGSTFKVGVACAALIEKIKLTDKNGNVYESSFSPYTKINTKGIYTFYDDYQPACWLYNMYKKSHGSINVTTAIEVSCNCFFYEIGRCLGLETINKYAKLYGFGQKTGIELSESVGVLADRAYSESIGVQWTGGWTIQTAIGQGFSRFTPIQMAGYLATIVDGGTRYSTHLLLEVREFGGEKVYSYAPTVVDSFEMSDLIYNTLITGMNKVVDENNNTVKAFNGFEIKVGGKTGTAQVDGQSCNGVYIGFAPLDDPEITVACVLERGAHGYNAAYVVRDVFDEYFKDRLNKTE